MFRKPLKNVTAYEGKPAKFEVVFGGLPPPKVTWYRENYEIQPSDEFQVWRRARRLSSCYCVDGSCASLLCVASKLPIDYD